MVAQVSGILQVDGNSPPDAPPVVVERHRVEATPVVRNQLQVAPPVVANVFMVALLNTIGFSAG